MITAEGHLWISPVRLVRDESKFRLDAGKGIHNQSTSHGSDIGSNDIFHYLDSRSTIAPAGTTEADVVKRA